MSLTLSIKAMATVGVVMLVTFATAGSSVYAQEDPNLVLSPAIIDVPGQVGSVATATVTLSNTSSEPMAVSAGSRALNPEDELIDESVRDRYDASIWLEFPKKDFLINGFTSIEVTLNIRVPPDAVPGGHYALASFSVLNDENPDESGILVTPELAGVVLVNVPGETTELLTVTADYQKGIYFGNKVGMGYTIQNIGNTHVIPIIKTEFYNSDGRLVDSVTQQARLLLPNTKRSVELSWQPKGSFSKYTAVTSVNYGTPTQVSVLETPRFTVLPSVKSLLIWLGLILVIFTGFKRLYKKVKRPLQTKEQTDNKR